MGVTFGKVFNFSKSNTPPWVFFAFFKLYRWCQIAQNMTNNQEETIPQWLQSLLKANVTFWTGTKLSTGIMRILRLNNGSVRQFCYNSMSRARLTHFMPLICFNTPWKHQKTSGVLMFSEGIKIWNELKTFDKWNKNPTYDMSG